MSRKDIEITRYELLQKGNVTHDTKCFRFAVPDSVDFRFLPGDHMRIYPDPDSPLEFRSYTPTTTPDESGFFELTIKRYPGGKVSPYLHKREPGDKVAMSGPHEGGHFEDGMAKNVGMVAGGTGITPMISIIRSILKRGLDVDISLLFANKTVDDIILKDEFDRYAAEYDNFTRYYVVDKAPDGWKMGEGRIDSRLMKDKLFEPSDDTVIFVCGPPMMQLDLKKMLIELGHEKDRIIFP
jgi:cytochrome-b5 reductase